MLMNQMALGSGPLYSNAFWDAVQKSDTAFQGSPTHLISDLYPILERDRALSPVWCIHR